ncbi:MAG: adenylyltransferase/cytidyltransferase family protein [Clostridia bacterium]|nr:adenylyltransferase/cytidyltransferase family protein [Clostridia bacterium]
MKKPYGLGIVVGRFQMIHAGHVDMINAARRACDSVAIFIGSSQESGTAQNPFTYETRAEMFRRVFGDSVKVFPLPDIGVGNVGQWGEYVISTVRERTGRFPDVLVSGKEERRPGWFTGENGARVAELYVPKTINVSASYMRELFISGDEETWRSFAPYALWDMYGSLRASVLASKDVTETASC